MKRSSFLLVFLFSFLLLGCNNRIPTFHIERLAQQRYDVGDAVPVLEYEGNGVVKYLTRSGVTGIIDLKHGTIWKDSISQFRLYGMPYQLIDSLSLISFRDNGIHIGDSILRIPKKGEHYSAYKSIPIDDNGSLLSVTSNGIYLYKNDGEAYNEGILLYPESNISSTIDSVRFVDLVKFDDHTYYAAGNLGVVNIDLNNKRASLEKGNYAPVGCISHLRVSEKDNKRTLFAYGINTVYIKEDSWKKPHYWDGPEGVLQTFVENVNGQEREWLIGFAKDIELYERTGEEGYLCKAIILDEQSSGMSCLNDRIRACAIDANEYGIVLARGRYIYLIPSSLILSSSEPVLSAYADKNNLYCTVGDHDEPRLYRATITDNGLEQSGFHMIIPRYGSVFGVRGSHAFVQIGNKIQEITLSSSRTIKTDTLNRLVSARMDPDGVPVYLCQDIILAYGDTLDSRIKGLPNQADFYPQAFVSMIGGDNPEIIISSIHEGLFILKREEKGRWTPESIPNKGFFFWDDEYDPAILMEKCSNDIVYFYTQKGRIGKLSRTPSGWEINGLGEPSSIPIDEMATDGRDLLGINYFTRGVIDLLSNNKMYEELQINSLCGILERGFVFSCDDGLYCSWDLSEPMSFNLSRVESLKRDYPTMVLASGIILSSVFILLILIIVLYLTGYIIIKSNSLSSVDHEVLKNQTTIETSEQSASQSSNSSSKQTFDKELNALIVSMKKKDDPSSFSDYFDHLDNAVRSSIGQDYSWGCAICKQLKGELELVRKYFDFLSTIESAFQAKFMTKEETTSMIESVKGKYAIFDEELRQKNSSSLAELDYLLKGFTRTENDSIQVRAYFVLPCSFIGRDANKKKNIEDFIKLDTFRPIKSDYKAGRGRFCGNLRDLVRQRRNEGRGIGLVALIGYGIMKEKNYEMTMKTYGEYPRAVLS